MKIVQLVVLKIEKDCRMPVMAIYAQGSRKGQFSTVQEFSFCTEERLMQLTFRKHNCWCIKANIATYFLNFDFLSEKGLTSPHVHIGEALSVGRMSSYLHILTEK